MESWYDIRYADKLKYLKIATEEYPELTEEAARTAAHLKRFHEHPKYEVFYEIKPLLDWIKGLCPPAEFPLDVLTRATIVALRITTLMRSGDLHNMVNNVHAYCNQYFVYARDKKGRLATARVDGITRNLVLECLFPYRNHPAPLFFRNQNNPAPCIGGREDRQALPCCYGGSRG